MALDRSATAKPVGIQICERLRAQIAAGVYPPGAAVPSTRALSIELGVSRTTVTAAYEQLVAEGFLEARQGARTRVASGLRTAALTSPTERADAPTLPPRLSAYGARALSSLPPPRPEASGLVADFRYGDLCADDFPSKAWRRAADGARVRRKARRLGYDDPSGLPELRTALQGYLWRARGLACDPDEIVVVNGSQQGIDLCARVFLDTGDRVVIEDPAYLAARQVFAAQGADLVPVPVDGDGMRTSALAQIGPARLAFVTPSHQFPLGCVMSIARRQDLLAWAQNSGAIVVEDDYDSEYRFDTQPMPALRSLDRAGVVVYVGTLSKTLSPQLRLGYLVATPPLATALAAAKHLSDRHTPTLAQASLARLIEEGAYERHVRRARRRNGARRAALLDALSRHFGDAVRVVGAAAGLHLVAWLDGVPRESEDDLVRAARAAGLGIYPVGPLYHRSGERPACAGLVLGYAALEVEAIEVGVRRLAQVVEEFRPRAGHASPG